MASDTRDENNPTYALKTIGFFGREVPIVLQNENGPCPLLAIINVLSLRNQIRLPVKARYTDQERLIALAANFLIESNSVDTSDATPEYRANLERNLADVMTMLPKLCTGVDVNLRFNDIKGFEFTREVAVFDLLDISLVHGWLVDPELEPEAAKAIDGKTYNELVQMLITALGSPAASAVATPTCSFKAGAARTEACATATAAAAEAAGEQTEASSAAAANRVDSASGSAAAAAASEDAAGLSATEGGELPHEVHEALGVRAADMDPEEAESLRLALALSLQTPEAPQPQAAGHEGSVQQQAQQGEQAAAAAAGGPAGSCEVPAPHGSPSGAAVAAADGDDSLGRGDAASTAVCYGGVDEATGCSGSPELQPAIDGGTEEQQQQQGRDEEGIDVERDERKGVEDIYEDKAGAGLDELDDVDMQEARVSSGLQTSSSIGSEQQQEEEQEDYVSAMVQGIMRRVSELHAGTPGARRLAVRPPLTPEEQAKVVAANAVKDFLDQHQSQLTEHGLSCLASGLRVNELAVFFRNNHFSTIFNYKGGLYLLVTDLGYQWERGVVWEYLCSVYGDTYFVKADFQQYTGESEQQARTEDGGHTAAALVRAAFGRGGTAASPSDAPATGVPVRQQTASTAAPSAAAGLPALPAAAAGPGEATAAMAGPESAPGLVAAAPAAARARVPGGVGGDQLPLQEQHSEDSDFQLALRLQQEEEEAHRRAVAQRRQQQQHADDEQQGTAAQQRQQQGMSSTRPQAAAAPQQRPGQPGRVVAAAGYGGASGYGSPHQQQQGGARRRASESGGTLRSKLADKDCSIM